LSDKKKLALGSVAHLSMRFSVMRRPSKVSEGCDSRSEEVDGALSCSKLTSFFAVSQAALNQLRLEGHEVWEADVTRLSPLIHDNINMLGRYSFAVLETVARGELRPLRNPAVDQE
jgi:Tn3 transposase DDE domain